MDNFLRANVCGTQSGYTVCFPATQKLADNTTQINPYYDFSAQQSVWTYTFTIDTGSKKFNHWQLGICSSIEDKDDFTIERSDDGGTTFSSISGFQILTAGYLRINESGNPDTSIIFRITIVNSSYYNLAAEAGPIILTVTSTDYTFDTSYDISTPSINCNIITPPQPPRGITIDDTIKMEKLLKSSITANHNSQ